MKKAIPPGSRRICPARVLVDGLHVNRNAYQIILELLRPYFAAGACGAT